MANFRKDNGKSIRNVNSSDRNFTGAKLKRRMEEIEANISRYFAELDSADRQELTAAEPKRRRLEEKIEALKLQMASLKEIDAKLVVTDKTQISLTDPDARSMMTRGSGIVGYNVQKAVDAKHRLIVEHEVTNIGNDRDQLSAMAKKARTAIGTTSLPRSQTAGTLMAKRSWPVMKLASPLWYRQRRPERQGRRPIR